MPASLLKLLRLQLKGWFRRQFTGSPKRLVFGIFGAVMFGLWFAAAIISSAGQEPKTREYVLTTLPFYLTVVAFLPILTGNDDRAIAFSPAEIDFLFPGPYTRRNLVVFKLLKLILSSFGGGVFFAIFLFRFAGSFVTCMAAAGITLTFINLIATSVALVRETIEERVYERGRRLLFFALLGGVVWIGWYISRGAGHVPLAGAPGGSALLDRMAQIAGSPLGRIVLAPGRVFAHLFAARSLSEFGGWALACLAMILGAVGIVLALDRRYTEAALAATQRRQRRLVGLRKGLAIAPGAKVREVRVPALSALGAPGAIVKKQLITATRASRTIILALFIAGIYGYVAARVATDAPHKGAALGGLAPGLFVLLTVLPQMLRFDFRSELDQMESIKALPISALGVSLAEMALPTALLAIVASVLVLTGAIVANVPPGPIVMAIAATFPISALIIGLENLVFLLLPTRLIAPGQAGAAFSGRRVLMLLARLALISIGGGAVAAVGLVAWSIAGSIAITFAACWLALAAVGAGMSFAVAWAYARFDVSADMPA